MTNDVLFRTSGAWGVITLARPAALNALTAAMTAAIDEALRGWADDHDVQAVLIEGEGERAFCAGGDIRWLATTAKDDPVKAATFFRTEYRLNALIAGYPKPYVALIDGICMGGGVGLSIMADRRVMTERSLWAMPECGIGLVPDVGASYALNRLRGGTGLYLALTGTRMKGADCLSAGIATHLVPDDHAAATREALLNADLSGDPLAAIDAALGAHNPADPGSFAQAQRAVDQHFSGVENLPDLLADLKEHGGAFGAGCLDLMAGGSPTSQMLTLRLLNHAPQDFGAAIKREFCVASRLLEGPDFLEGVRAQVIDKDRKPVWNPSTLAGVEKAALDRYFEEPEGGPLVLD